VESKTRIDLPLLLPDVPDERDACVARLETLLARGKGIVRAHVPAGDGQPPKLCLHYDPSVVSLTEVQRLAHAAGIEVTKRFGHTVLPIRALRGEDASRQVENDLLALPGVLSASVNLAAQTARVEFDRTQVQLAQIEGHVRKLGNWQPPEAALTRAEQEGAAETGGTPAREQGERQVAPAPRSWYAKNKELAWSLAGGVLLALAWTAERWLHLPHWGAVTLYVASYAFGAFDLISHATKSLLKGRLTFDIDLLMLVAAIGAAILGEWVEGAFLLFLFSLAHSLEHYALGRARNAISALRDLAPPKARVLRSGGEQEIPIEQVAHGDVVVVRPGERIPVDGKVRSGRSAVNQAPITGESVPVEKGDGDEVFAGTVNGEGALEVTTTRAAGDRTLDRVVKLVAEASTQKAPTQQFTDRFERYFVPAVLVSAGLVAIAPPLLHISGWGWTTSFYRAMALLVAASPCALALGTPATVLAGIAQAARKGVLIKGGAHLENLGTLRAMAFDKTGTLTQGKPEVTDLAPANGVSADELLTIAAAVEARSQHPLAQAVVARAKVSQLDVPQAGDLESVTGRGVRSIVRGSPTEIGNLRLWRDEGSVGAQVPADVVDAVSRLQEQGRSILVVRHGDRWLGTIGVADQPRPGVRDVLNRLRALGLRRLVMLTGDNRGVGEAVGTAVGVDATKAELLPEDKVTAIEELLAAEGQVAMVGDGINDAPALAHATVGIAMGGAGTAVALETADVALMGDDLSRLPFAVGLSRQARRVIRQNLYISLGVIAFLVISTVTGLFGIGLTVVVHEGSTLVVIANALRLLGYRETNVDTNGSPGAGAHAGSERA
jgi:Cd2+/Zn2+-exporting ATPase